MSTRGFNDLMSVNSGGDSVGASRPERRAHFKDHLSGMKLLSGQGSPKKLSNSNVL